MAPKTVPVHPSALRTSWPACSVCESFGVASIEPCTPHRTLTLNGCRSASSVRNSGALLAFVFCSRTERWSELLEKVWRERVALTLTSFGGMMRIHSVHDQTSEDCWLSKVPFGGGQQSTSAVPDAQTSAWGCSTPFTQLRWDTSWNSGIETRRKAVQGEPGLAVASARPLWQPAPCCGSFNCESSRKNSRMTHRGGARFSMHQLSAAAA